MSTLPEPLPRSGENSAESESCTPSFPATPPLEECATAPPEIESRDDLPPPSSPPPSPLLLAYATQPRIEPELFASYSYPAYASPRRTPNFGDVGLLLILLALGWFGAGSILLIAVHFHLFGVSTLKQAVDDFRYTLGSQAIQYFISFCGCLLVFPLVWHRGFFAGLHWRARTALHQRGRLFTAAMLCFVAAVVNGLLMPGPTDAPIDKIFRAPGAAWVLFAFGITLAPFFEELAFRGFLLPALCTAYDWFAERVTQTSPRPLDENGHPQWSVPAMSVAAILTSVPFALMHGEQTSYSLGPFLLLICVSLVLCWARISTRSLAASVMVHASYNFLLFSMMLLGTGGFKYLDKM